MRPIPMYPLTPKLMRLMRNCHAVSDVFGLHRMGPTVKLLEVQCLGILEAAGGNIQEYWGVPPQYLVIGAPRIPKDSPRPEPPKAWL